MNLELVDQVGPETTLPICCHRPMSYRRVLRSDGEQHLSTCLSCGKEHVLSGRPNFEKKGVQGHVTIELIDAHTGKKRIVVEDDNVFTDVGRNYLASLISYSTFSQTPGTNEPSSSKRRYDGVRYIGVGTGTQLETSSVSALVNPVAYNAAGDYLAQIVAPNELPGTGISAVFQRIFGVNEISLPATVNVSEVALYPSGPESSPLAVSSGIHPPIAYKTFVPVPVTTDFLFSVRWEIKF